MTGPWRLGNRNPNNLYRGEQHVGMLIDPELAKAIVTTMNGASKAEDWGACCDHRALQLHRLREEWEAGMGDAGGFIADAMRSRGLLDEARFVTEYAERGFPRPQKAVDPDSPPA